MLLAKYKQKLIEIDWLHHSKHVIFTAQSQIHVSTQWDLSIGMYKSYVLPRLVAYLVYLYIHFIFTLCLS